MKFETPNLTVEFGKGFTIRSLRAMHQFYQTFPIRHTLRAGLAWSHYCMLMCNENLFASKYRLYLPSEEELRAELQRECELIERQIKEERER